jgi:nucleotide sugar dehydrogenase
MEKVLVIGLGQIGQATAKYMTEHGLHVEGYDITHNAVEQALESKVIEWGASDFQNYDYYIICVSTHNIDDKTKPDVNGVMDIAKKLRTEGKGGSLVSIESTISRGSSMKVHKILSHKFHLVHVPHRYYEPEKNIHGVNQVRVIGAIDDCCMEDALEFYTRRLGITLHQVPIISIAELSKIIENTYRYTLIAFAEEVKMVCDKMHLDFEQVRTAVNTKWNVNMLEAKSGIGGHCLPKDLQMFLDMDVTSGIPSLAKAAKELDEFYHQHHLIKATADYTSRQ